MNYNSYNTYGKRGLGSVKIGRYICPSCNNKYEEERSFWEKLKEDFFDIVSRIEKLLRLHHDSYQGISDIMVLIYPLGRDTSMAFLMKYLDPNKRTFVVTDLYPSYPGVFEEFFGENLIRELLLNKLENA